jgi:hypothetical protein
MRCPKCQFDHASQTTECLRCGIVFSRFEEPAVLSSTKSNEVVTAPTFAQDSAEDQVPPRARNDAYKELKYRIIALPLALLVARLLASSGFGAVSGMLAMVLHESGHAITAWLAGRWAVPMLWVTMHGDDRSWLVVLAVTTAIGCGGFLAWRARLWGWVCAAAAMLIVQVVFLNAPAPPGALIVFGGDGGALLLSTVLMAAFYAPRESWVYKNWGLRWGLLVIGALSFMYVFHSWSGPYENIPFGEIEGVNLSDPSLLTEMYGWSVIQLVDRYIFLATACLVTLAVVYIWGLIAAYAEIWTATHARVSAASQSSS